MVSGPVDSKLKLKIYRRFLTEILEKNSKLVFEQATGITVPDIDLKGEELLTGVEMKIESDHADSDDFEIDLKLIEGQGIKIEISELSFEVKGTGYDSKDKIVISGTIDKASCTLHGK